MHAQRLAEYFSNGFLAHPFIRRHGARTAHRHAPARPRIDELKLPARLLGRSASGVPSCGETACARTTHRRRSPQVTTCGGAAGPEVELRFGLAHLALLRQLRFSILRSVFASCASTRD